MINSMDDLTAKRTLETARKFASYTEMNFFLGKYQKISEFILNSGNSYVTLRLELCPVAS